MIGEKIQEDLEQKSKEDKSEMDLKANIYNNFFISFISAKDGYEGTTEKDMNQYFVVLGHSLPWESKIFTIII